MKKIVKFRNSVNISEKSEIKLSLNPKQKSKINNK